MSSERARDELRPELRGQNCAAELRTSRIVMQLATTATWSSGTRCATQIAPVPLGSERMWKTKASSTSPTISTSPAPPSAP